MAEVPKKLASRFSSSRWCGSSWTCRIGIHALLSFLLSEQAECSTQDDHSYGVNPVHIMPHCLGPPFWHRQVSLLAKRQSRPQKGHLHRYTGMEIMGSSALRAAQKRGNRDKADKS